VPAGDEKAYLEWILGPEGQKVVAAVEYIPLKGGLDTTASAKP
jgi:ABC-type phosphate transport system substrate-binding protein